MKRLLFAITMALALCSGPAFARGHGGSSYHSTGGGSVHVRGHVAKNGTYVAPHVRTAPNQLKYDNWSTKGNANPYTGKKGEKDPYR